MTSTDLDGSPILILSQKQGVTLYEMLEEVMVCNRGEEWANMFKRIKEFANGFPCPDGCRCNIDDDCWRKKSDA